MTDVAYPTIPGGPTATTLHYTLLDALGSVRALVTPSGTITYYPWVAAGDLWLDNPMWRSWLALVHRPNAVKWGRGAGCGGQWGSWFAKNLD